MTFLKKILRQILPYYLVMKYDDWLLRKSENELITSNKYLFEKYRRLLSDERFLCRWEDSSITHSDNTGATKFDAHYIYHPAWAARKLNEIQPEKHIDISSYLDFSTLVSAFVETEFYDFRPASVQLDGLTCSKGDATALPFKSKSVESISCMHVVEHIGLGRYGDELDAEGDLKAISELKRVISDDGHIYFVVPIGGVANIQFNKHRVYTYQMVKGLFDEFDIVDFSLVTDSGDFIPKSSEKLSNEQVYGCGCFLLKRKV